MINLDAFGDKTPKETCLQVAQQMRARRKERGLSRAELSKRSGVTVSSLRRFEETGEISFHSLVRLAKTLDEIPRIESIFAKRHYVNIQEVIDAKNY